MARALRTIGSIALWAGAAVGVLTCLVWAATALGVLKPLIVTSGSMEPTIETGALLVSVPVAGDEIAPGDVLTLPSDITGGLVTHRVESVEATDAGWDIAMRGDANPVADPEVYVVTESAWTPALNIPGAGAVLASLSRPSVVIPALIALAALLGMSMVRDDRAKPAAADAVEEKVST
ncbi:signal peptidase I [Demequina globuliformis]|uniref:signal peptidase I n=1 Tax=Demequina globuliformis TaxID=676202 RepID=UPI00078201CE|nr:signal peptidase I [Demequina globuliformis]